MSQHHLVRDKKKCALQLAGATQMAKDNDLSTLIPPGMEAEPVLLETITDCPGWQCGKDGTGNSKNKAPGDRCEGSTNYVCQMCVGKPDYGRWVEEARCFIQ